jgi:hypothetical protein
MVVKVLYGHGRVPFSASSYSDQKGVIISESKVNGLEIHLRSEPLALSILHMLLVHSYTVWLKTLR